MAESSKKSKSVENDPIGDLDDRLRTVGDAIERRIQSVLAPVTFDVALKTYSGYLSNELPPSLWTKLFRKEEEKPIDDKASQRKSRTAPDSEKPERLPSISENPEEKEIENGDHHHDEEPSTEEDRPDPLEQLSLGELVVICQTLPPLKTKFGQEEKQGFEKLHEVLKEAYLERLIKLAPSKEREDRIRSIEDRLAVVLEVFGSKEDEDEKKPPRKLGKVFEDDGAVREDILKSFERRTAKSKADHPYSEKELEELTNLISSERARIRKEPPNPKSLSSLARPIHQSIQQALTCGYCHQLPKDPRTLPCLHVFCAPCLKSTLSSTGGNGANAPPPDRHTIGCSECQTRISLPSEAHVDQLPRGFVAENLLKLHEVTGANGSKTTTIAECAFCFHPPSHICLLCHDFYCPEHASGFYKHDTINLLQQETGSTVEPRPSHADMLVELCTLTSADRVSAILYEMCPQHRQRLSHFCPGCRVPLCSHMLCVDWHSQHVDAAQGLRPLDEVIAEERQKLAAIEMTLRKKAERVRTKIDSVEKNQITVADVQENVRHSIDQYFADIEERLAKHKVSFISDLDKAAAQCFQNDEGIHARLQSWSERVEKLETTFRSYFDIPPNADPKSTTAAVASVPELVSLRFRILQQLTDSCSGALVASTKRLSYPETRLRELQHIVGTLQSNITNASAGRGWEGLIKFTTGAMNPAAVGVPGDFAVDSLKQAVYVVKGRGMVASAQVLSYDLKQTENRSASPRIVCDAGSRSFESVAVDHQGRRVFVAEQPQSALELPSMKFKKCIQIRVLEYNSIGAFGQSRTASLEHFNIYAKAIVKYAADRAYVCDGSCVCEYDLSGDGDEFKLMRKFNFHNMLDISDFAVDPRRDFMYVVDGRKHSLLIFDCQHQTVKNIGDQGVTPGRFDQPSGVAIDEFGHVFVADGGNHRVQVFDVEGRFLRMVQYPQVIKEISLSPATLSDQKTGALPSAAKVTLQVGEDCLYMHDSRSDQLWRYRYL